MSAWLSGLFADILDVLFLIFLVLVVLSFIFISVLVFLSYCTGVCMVHFFVVFVCACCLFFFFKQKTAYEMRISDGSSDVCSSDLSLEIGLPILGIPEKLGGISEERSAMAGTLVAEALAKGDMGLAVAALAPGAVATAISLWGTDAQQATYLPAFTGDDVPAASLALNESRPLFDVLRPETKAVKADGGYLLNGVKTLVPRGADAELFVVGAELDGKNVLFLVESGTEGIAIEGDPAMGVRAAGLNRKRVV